MASARRTTVWINFVRVPPQLKELVSRDPKISQFIRRHGRLISLVIPGFDEDMMSVLFQFFDLAHHCFTFPDYQLVPTMKEFSQILDVPILDQMPFTSLEEAPKPEVTAAALHLKQSDIVSNWEMRSGVKGFLVKFLIEKA